MKLGKIFKNHKEIIIAIIIGISLIGYALIARQTKLDALNNEIKQERLNRLEEQISEDEKDAKKRIQLTICLTKAENDFWEAWKLNCSSDIVKDEDGEIESCSVYSSIGDKLKDQKQKDKDRCADLYK